MKIKMNKIAPFFALLLLAVLLLPGCAPIIDNSGAAYVSVEKELHWKHIYQVGEDLSLDGLTVKYFPNVSDLNDFETVTLTRDMISGFDTSKEGSFEMTVTYKGKTATVGYTVVPKATPFEIIKTFCIAENTVVSIDSTSMKATVLVFDNYFKATENQPAKTEEKKLSYLVNSKGKTCVSFEYNGSRYDFFDDAEGKQYPVVITLIGGGSVQQTLATPITLSTLQLPRKNTVYKSELKDGIYYSIKIDDSYNAVVTKHTVEGSTTVDAVLDSYLASDAVLTANGLFKYWQHKDGYSASATMSTQEKFRVRKEADGVTESIYSALCSPAT